MGRHTRQVDESLQPVHPPVRSIWASAIPGRRNSPCGPSVIKLMGRSRPTLHIVVKPSGSTWNDVCPAGQPWKTSLFPIRLGTCVSSVDPLPVYVGEMDEYSLNGKPRSRTIA